jgi:hypothetical protein
MEIEGIVNKVYPVENGKSKAGKDYSRTTIIIDTQKKFDPLVAVDVFGADKCDMALNLKVGSKAKLFINIKSREYNDKWYTTANLWKVENLDQAQPSQQTQKEPLGDISPEAEPDEDDLPF